MHVFDQKPVPQSTRKFSLTLHVNETKQRYMLTHETDVSTIWVEKDRLRAKFHEMLDLILDKAGICDLSGSMPEPPKYP